MSTNYKFYVSIITKNGATKADSYYLTSYTVVSLS